MIEYYVDKDGSIVARFSPKEWADWINEFLEERTFLLIRERVTVEDEAKWLAKTISDIKKGIVIKVIAIDEDKNRIVGVCDVHKKKPLQAHGHNVSFGLAVRREYRGRGIGEKLLREGIRIAKEEFKAKNIWIEVVEGNEIAKRLYEKLGFKEVCRLKDYVNHFGKYKDRIVMRFKDEGF